MRFDPDSDRQSLHELMIPLAREADFAEVSRARVLEGHARSILATGTDCLLVGEFVIGMELVAKAFRFVVGAIDQLRAANDPRRCGALSLCLNNLVLCRWFLERRHDGESATEAVHQRERWFGEHKDAGKNNVQLGLPCYLDAEQYDTLIDRFMSAGIKKPKNLRSIKGEGTMSYVIARHRLGLEYSDAEINAALQTFFKRNVGPIWLEFGQYDAVALWMKIAFWKPGDDPIATLLKCYDYLSGIEQPKYATPDTSHIDSRE